MKKNILNIKNKVYLWFLNNFIAKSDEYYDFTEPSREFMVMNNKKFWIQSLNINENGEECV